MDELNELLKALQNIIDATEALGDNISPEMQEEATNTINALVQRIEQIGGGGQEPPITPPRVQGEEPTGGGVELLWILAGGDETAFLNYLRTMPVPEAQVVLRYPQELQALINELKISMPQGFLETQEADGIHHAPLQSSNVYGYQYDPKTQKLLVRFNSGSIYRYDGVPPSIYNAFTRFMVPCKTSGQNEFGIWFRGKQPSVGSSFYEYIRSGAFPYQRVA